MTRDEICREVLEKPLGEITEDPFFRADNFMDKPWYNEFMIYRNLGVCQPEPKHVPEVQKALKVMGYSTHTTERNGKVYLLPGEERGESMREECKIEQLEEKRERARYVFKVSARKKDHER